MTTRARRGKNKVWREKGKKAAEREKSRGLI